MGNKVKAFGEVMMRLAPPEHLKLQQTNSLNIIYTGTGVNVLSSLSHFGYDTALISRLPTNNVGDAAVSHIRSLGIGSKDILRSGQYIGMNFLEQGFDVRPTTVTYSNRSESSFCTSNITDYDLDEIFTDTKMIHFCGITLAISDQTRQLILSVAKAAQERGITVVFDSNYRPKLWNYQYDEARKWYRQLLPYVDICLMTEEDAEFVLGMTTNFTKKKDKREDLLPRVAKEYGISYIVGTIRNETDSHQSAANTYGKAVNADAMNTENESIQGFLYHNSAFHYSNVYTFKVLDRIGAGDGFASGIIHGYDQGLANAETIEFATAAGVLAHTTYGDSPVSTMSDVYALMKNSGRTGVDR